MSTLADNQSDVLAELRARAGALDEIVENLDTKIKGLTAARRERVVALERINAAIARRTPAGPGRNDNHGRVV